MDEKIYTPLSDVEESLRIVTCYDPMCETLTVDLADAEEFPLLGTAEECGNLCARMAVMDEHYWPPVNPIPGRVENGKLVALVALGPLTNAGAEHIRKLADKLGLLYEDIC